jgi:tetratricopeptide (TPR) repeat protein
VFLLVFTPLVIFWQAHSHEFVLWDDNVNVFENPALRSVTLDNILGFWRAPYAHLYIPCTYTLWALTAALSRWVIPQPTGSTPIDPHFFHSLNLLVHLLSVLVVWRIVRILLGRTMREEQSPASGRARIWMECAACSGALLFAVHPLQVEAVAWVTGFKDVLGGCLSFVAIWQYLQYARGGVAVASPGKPARGQVRRTWIPYGFATGAFVLALLAKPTAVVVPVVAWLLDVWGWPQTWRTRRAAVLAWLVIAMLLGFFTSQVQPATTLLFTVPLWMRPLIAGDAVAFYLYKLVFPVWLGPDYGRAPEVMLPQSWLWFTGLVPWGLAAWLWHKRTRVPWLVAAAGVFVAGLLPVLGFIPFGFQNYSTVADRYVYIAMLGPALALAWGLTQSPRRVLAIGCVVILGILGIRSAWQTRYWHTTVSLFEHALTVHPGSALAHNNLGLAMANQGRSTEALHHYTEALRLQPRNAEAHNNLGNVLVSQGQTQEAMQHYAEALRLDPTFAEAHNNLGTALVNQGRSMEAIEHYTAALRFRPSYARAHYNLGNVFNRQGKMQEAIQQYTAALRLQPNFAEAHHNLGATLADEGHIAEAIEHYTEALRLRPHYVNAHYNLGLALAKQGRLTEAREHFAEVLRLDPTHAAARRFLESSGQ